jgi:glucokinase
MGAPVYLGVDVGGTKVAAGLVDSRGQILYKARVPMHGRGTAHEGFASVREAINRVLAANPAAAISAVGVASPGPLDPRSGIILFTPNIPCWHDFNLREAIEDAYHLPTRVDNDANAAGLAEAIFGAGRGYSSVFYATLGTGIGTAIVLNGRLYYGRTGLAAEGGHQTVDMNGAIHCECGKPGCVESLASGTAIARLAREALRRDPTAGEHILRLAAGDINSVTGRTVSQAWHEGDLLATELLTESARVLTAWLGNIVDMLEPDVFVIGGGMSEVFSSFFPQMLRDLPRWSLNKRCGDTPLVRAHFGEDSGLVGAAALCLSDPLAQTTVAD